VGRLSKHLSSKEKDHDKGKRFALGGEGGGRKGGGHHQKLSIGAEPENDDVRPAKTRKFASKKKRY